MDRLRRRCLQALGCQAASVGGLCAAPPSAAWSAAAAAASTSAARATTPATDASAPVHALLIGCGRYIGLGPAQQLPGAEADVSLMRRSLLTTYGDRLSVQALDSADASQPPTHRAVLQALDAWSAQTPPGALAWLYLAGHGTRRPQPAAGSRYPEPDGQDELFLPMDSGRWQEGIGTVARSIRDDEIQQRLDHLQQRGVSVVAWFDTCHAAGMDRGLTPLQRPDGAGLPGTRARAMDIALLGGPPAPAMSPPWRRPPAASAHSANRRGPAPPAPRDLTRLTLLYACRKHEQAFEGWVLDGQGRRHRQGWFTWYALQAWQALRASGQPWDLAQLQQRINRAYESQGIVASNPQLLGEVAPLQHPQVSSNPQRTTGPVSR